MATKKTKKVEVTLPAEPKTTWQKIWGWFYNSGTIVWNWLLGAVGAVGATVAGVLASVDWSQPIALLQRGATLTKENWILIGAGTFLAGVIGYFTRRSGTKVVDNTLLPRAE